MQILPEMLAQVQGILDTLLANEFRLRKQWKKVSTEHRESARNLIHYLSLRTFDLRELQAALSEMGLSSVGSSGRVCTAKYQPDPVFAATHCRSGRTGEACRTGL